MKYEGQGISRRALLAGFNFGVFSLLYIFFAAAAAADVPEGEPCNTDHYLDCKAMGCERYTYMSFNCCNTYKSVCCQRICLKRKCILPSGGACTGLYVDNTTGIERMLPCDNQGLCLQIGGP